MNDSSNAPSRVAVIGYGLAGSAFHAPLIYATPDLTLAAVVTSDAAKTADIHRRYPNVQVLPDADSLWAQASSLDLVVIAAPNAQHSPLAHAALEAGLAVVVDKPLASSYDEARALAEDARARGLALTVFHNRRWDADFLTVRRLLDSGELGTAQRFESRFERWRPHAKPGWRRAADPRDAGGVLFDLGSHLIDQAMQLFGDVRQVYAELDQRYPDSEVDDDSFVALTHGNGVRSHLWMSSFTPQLGPRFRVLGDRAAYVTYGLDPQEAALRAGVMPGDQGFGEEAESAWGRLGTEDNVQIVPSETGRYIGFYEGVAAMLRQRAAPPVDPMEALQCLAVIDAAQRSSAGREVVTL
ncbi:MAG: Gfo/Idh/MocA family oxidoreductase [Salinisphaera sp.]|jgi:scyllo-inositol 2-dehydrogenase (NADP+)|nr:Gfo/Idh/MocA family oxidoreductase [Salinisphaera sp.]